MKVALEQIAKENGLNAAILLAVEKDPKHPFLKKQTLVALLTAYYQSVKPWDEDGLFWGSNEPFENYLRQRIYKEEKNLAPLLAATKYWLASVGSRDFPWESLIHNMLNLTKTSSQFKQVVKLSTGHEAAVVNFRRWQIIEQELPKANSIKKLMALKKLAKADDQMTKDGASLYGWPERESERCLAKIDQLILNLAKKSPKEIIAIVTKDKYDLGRKFVDEATALLQV